MDPTNLFISKVERRFPLVKIIQVAALYYLYDAKSCLLTEVDLNDMKILSDSDCSFLLPGPLKQITPDPDEMSDIIEFQLNTKLPKALIIEVTESCNLSCRYCFFSKEQGFSNRSHSNSYMDESTAFKAIDYYYSRFVHVLEQIPFDNRAKLILEAPPMLQWWGGEPFKAFELIKKTKIYFENLDWEKCGITKDKITFGLTSNLTIYNNDILNFLVTNNIKLKVSLDGDEKSHNINRIYCNGEGTFKKVIGNINKIIEANPEYAKNNVGIQSVLASNIDVITSQTFINTYFGINTSSNKLLANTASVQREKGVFLSETESVKEEIGSVLISFREKLSEIADKTSVELNELFKNNSELRNELLELLSVEDKLVFEESYGSDYFHGLFSCSLAVDTIMVSSQGDIHCCCKTDYSIPLGHISTGLFKDNIKNVYVKYHESINKQCKSCWAFRFCNICPAMTCWNEEFVLPNEKECENIRKKIMMNLMKYIVLQEDYNDLYYQLIICFKHNANRTKN